MDPIVITSPSVEPVSLARARQWLRIDVPGYSGDTSQDLDIQSMVRAARQWVEKETDKSIGLQTLMITGESFCALGEQPYGYGYGQRRILLPRGPVRSITSVAYLTTDDFDLTVDPALYRLTAQAPQSVVLKRGQAWPGVSVEPESVRITYVAGYIVPTLGTGIEAYADDYADSYTSGPGAVLPYDLPDDMIAAMRLILGHLYRYRSASVDVAMQELPLGVRALLWPSRASVGV